MSIKLLCIYPSVAVVACHSHHPNWSQTETDSRMDMHPFTRAYHPHRECRDSFRVLAVLTHPAAATFLQLRCLLQKSINSPPTGAHQVNTAMETLADSHRHVLLLPGRTMAMMSNHLRGLRRLWTTCTPPLMGMFRLLHQTLCGQAIALRIKDCGRSPHNKPSRQHHLRSTGTQVVRTYLELYHKNHA